MNRNFTKERCNDRLFKSVMTAFISLIWIVGCVACLNLGINLTEVQNTDFLILVCATYSICVRGCELLFQIAKFKIKKIWGKGRAFPVITRDIWTNIVAITFMMIATAWSYKSDKYSILTLLLIRFEFWEKIKNFLIETRNAINNKKDNEKRWHYNPVQVAALVQALLEEIREYEFVVEKSAQNSILIKNKATRQTLKIKENTHHIKYSEYANIGLNEDEIEQVIQQIVNKTNIQITFSTQTDKYALISQM